jgi:hypothetical protein
MGDLRDHWDGVYAARPETAVSWYQARSVRSLAYITAAANKDAALIDIGGGASTLVDDLLERGYRDLTVLDVADAALDKAKARLGQKASRVSWIVADITQWRPPRQYAVWHDRAVFHFLTRAEQRKAYVAALLAGTAPGATVIVATFAPDGPDTCSGLPVQRYSPRTLAAEIGPPFVLTDETREMHTTPSGAQQPFSYVVFRREVN